MTKGYMLTLQDLQLGDVLLCRPPSELSLSKPIRQRIAAITGSPYTHAAIVLSGSEVLDARPWHGVKIRPLVELVGEAMHVAVLRHPDAWDDSRRDSLRLYATTLETRGAGYNWKALRYTANKHAHADGMKGALAQYFETGEQKPPTNYGPFFCSELVAACFVVSGFIHPSAAIVIDPAIHAPGDLAKEPTFGYLVGFVARDPSASVPTDDPLLMFPRYADIFEN